MTAEREIGYVISGFANASFMAVLDPKVRVRLYDYVVVEDAEVGKMIGQVIKIFSSPYWAGAAFPPFPVVKGASGALKEVRKAIVKMLGNLSGGRMPKEPPRVGAPVRLASEEEIEALYGRGDLCVGRLSARDTVDICLDLDNLNRHMAVIATTGSGKTWFSVVLIEELLKRGGQVVVLDPHGEYVEAAKTAEKKLGKRSVVAALLERQLERDVKSVAYRIGIVDMDTDDLVNAAEVPSYANVIREVIHLAHSLAKKVHEETGKEIGLDDLITILDEAMKGEKELQRLLNKWGMTSRREVKEMADFALASVPPREVKDLPREVKDLASRASEKRDSVYGAKRYLKMLSWLGVFSAKSTALSEIDADLVVFNLAGVTGKVFDYVAWHILDRIFEARVRYVRNMSGERLERPVVVVLEEAHRFAPPKREDRTKSYDAVVRIATEGRKFGVHLVVITQRPSRVDQDIMSQMGTQVLMRITNPTDQDAVKKASEHLTQEYLDGLPGLDVGEAIVMGRMMKLPAVIRVRDRVLEYGGGDISLSKEWGKRRAEEERGDEGYREVVDHWRRLFGSALPPSVALEAKRMSVKQMRNEGSGWRVVVDDGGKEAIVELSLERPYARCSCGGNSCPHVYKALEEVLRRTRYYV